ncbi:MAG: ribosome-associated translation inhibitor RaiA [Chloroflexota bacterium]
MELLIKGKNVEVPEPVRSYIEKKFGKLSRHIPSISQAEVELSFESVKAQSQRFAVEVTLNCGGTLLRSEERAGDFFAGVNAVAEVLDRQIRRFKGRVYRSSRKAGGAVLPPEIEEEEEEVPEGRVVRVKRFPVKPMSDEEALEQMELLGHDFFVFYNTATDSFSVVYRRKDGDYGIIHPELG